MIKRYNYVKRRRIPRGLLRFEVLEGPQRTFSGTLDLASMAFEPDAAVVVEAIGSGQAAVCRIECGTIADLRQPAHVSLEEITARHVMFFVKVIDRSESAGRLLGLAERVRPAVGGGGDSLLPVDLKDLGELLWRVDRRDADNYYLELSTRVHGLEDRLKNDPLTAALVLPQALTQILTDVLRAIPDADDDADEDWRYPWVAFAKALVPEWPANAEEHEGYIRDVVDAFAAKHAFATACARLLGEAAA